jgi:putative methyltransferase (TIGR04325 family)
MRQMPWAGNKLWIRFSGDYASWAQAEAASRGYGTQEILHRTTQAARKVKSGQAAFERDGVAFEEMECHFPLAWALMRSAVRHRRLHVLDFGGSLGSVYFQLRHLIGSIPSLKWAVVEQPAHVKVGTQEFANNELSFHCTMEDACTDQRFDVLLLSGVLQCLPDPMGFLDAALAHGIPSIILERTPFMTDGKTRLTVQHVPKRIYPASYPSWFFSEKEVVGKLMKRYDKITDWPALDMHHPEGDRADYKGFLFELKREANSLLQ